MMNKKSTSAKACPTGACTNCRVQVGVQVITIGMTGARAWGRFGDSWADDSWFTPRPLRGLWPTVKKQQRQQVVVLINTGDIDMNVLKPLLGVVLSSIMALSAHAQQAAITLHGASQFGDDHAFTKTMVKFEELVKKYYGKPVNFVLHKNSELGLEKDYFAYMNQGKAVDFAIVSPAHMSTFSKAAPFIDAPFLFSDLNHWNKVLDQDVLKPIADEVEQKAEVKLIGYAGGGVRNIFSNKSAGNMAELRNLKIRVQGAPIWSRTFGAVGMTPTVIAYNEVYNAIQNGVIQAGENEAAGVEAMKFFEVAPNILMTRHAITIRPLCFSVKTLKRLPADLQAAIVRAGKEAGAFGRQIESSEDQAKLDKYAREGKLKQVPFTQRAEMQRLAEPVMAAYAKEVGADAIYARINALK
jgi:TRAP-type C4-dicarboxylate transport system substrate-binding protein